MAHLFPLELIHYRLARLTSYMFSMRREIGAIEMAATANQVLAGLRKRDPSLTTTWPRRHRQLPPWLRSCQGLEPQVSEQRPQ